MAGNLTTQVRGIAKVVTAVANGDLKRKLVLETKGEIAELADTINGMIDTLASSPTRSRRSPAKSVPKENSADRLACLERPVSGKILPTT